EPPVGGFAPAIVQHAGKGQLRDPMAGCTPVAPTTSRWRATGSPSPATGRLCSCLLAGAVAALQEREGDFGLGQHPLMGTHLIDGTDQVVGVESRADRERAGGGPGGRGRSGGHRTGHGVTVVRSTVYHEPDLPGERIVATSQVDPLPWLWQPRRAGGGDIRQSVPVPYLEAPTALATVGGRVIHQRRHGVGEPVLG